MKTSDNPTTVACMEFKLTHTATTGPNFNIWEVGTCTKHYVWSRL